MAAKYRLLWEMNDSISGMGLSSPCLPPSLSSETKSVVLLFPFAKASWLPLFGWWYSIGTGAHCEKPQISVLPLQ